MVGVLDYLLVALGGHGHDERPASAAFPDVRDDFAVDRRLRGDGYHGESLGQKRDRSVFHLACRVRLGMQVADLLQLQRALVRDGAAHPASDEESARGVFAGLRRLLYRRRVGEDALDLLGSVGQLAEQQPRLRDRHLALSLREHHRKQR